MLIEEILRKYDFAPVVPFDLSKDTLLKIDLTAENTDLEKIDLTNTAIFTEYVFAKIQEAHAVCAIGGYFENRYIYRRSEHFQQTEEARSIHLGVDIWAAAGTAVFAPLAGKVHSFANNDNFGDYTNHHFRT
jgi:murein DD-endopeptidase MepM/ murein hydrolase activator NlpD